MSDLAAIFAATAAAAATRPALVSPSGSVSFAELDARAGAFAGQLAARGVGRGARVLVAAPIEAELYAMLAGIWKVGAVAVFPEPAMGLRGLFHAVDVARPAAFAAAGPYRWLRFLPRLWRLPFVSPGAAPRAPIPAKLGPDDAALISFTSGSTGRPKAIQRSHGFMLAQHAALLPLLGSDPAPRDLVAFPIFALINLAVGRTSILPAWRQGRIGKVDGPALRAWIEETRATRLLLPPVLCEALADAPVPGQITHVFTGGGPVFPDVLDRLRQGRPDLSLSCVYGSSEAEPIACLEASGISATDRAAMSGGGGLLAGRPVPQVRLRIVDDEIQVAGSHVNRGYLDPRRDAETKVADLGELWHRTGDAGRIDEAGRLWLLGRAGAVLRRDGRALYPFAIETAARTWPGVRRTALAEVGGRAVLAVEGEGPHLAEWTARARNLGLDGVRQVAAIPMDRRHGSKVDYAALRRLLGT